MGFQLRFQPVGLTGRRVGLPAIALAQARRAWQRQAPRRARLTVAGWNAFLSAATVNQPTVALVQNRVR
jgi:hypothetical protein